MLLDVGMMVVVCDQIENLCDAEFSFDGKNQAAAFPVRGITALYQSLPDIVDTEGPRTVITSRYNDHGGNLDGLESKQPDH
jgi:hypothetical protein